MWMSADLEKLSWVASIAGVLGIPSIFVFIFKKIQTKKYNSSQIVISGKWNLGVAKQKVDQLLEAYAWDESQWGLESPLVHNLAGNYNLIYKGREGMVLVTATATEKFDCHACAPYLSFFEFENVDDSWSLVTTDICAYRAGSWGEPPRLSVRVLAEERYAVFMEDGYMAQGHITSVTTVIARIGNSFQEVLCILDSESSPNEEGDNVGWQSNFEPIVCATGLYDLRVTRWGDPNSEGMVFIGNADEQTFRNDVASLDGKIRPIDIFRFNGQKYVRVLDPNGS